jgi:hypothetical protein
MYTTATLTVLTESGARYLLRQHGTRCYVTRLGDVPMHGNAPVNRVTSQPVVCGEGKPMVVRFDNGNVLRTTPVLKFSVALQRYA